MEVAHVMRQFLAGTPIKQFEWKVSDEEWLIKDEKWQRDVLNATLLHPLLSKYQLCTRYKKDFLKIFISKLEQANSERSIPILDELYELYAEFMMKNNEEEEFFYRIYAVDSDVFIPMKESASFVLNGSTGLVTWQAGKMLADWALENSESFENRRVLELGCGAGLTGITVCKVLHPRSYVFTDAHPQVLASLKHNLLNNFQAVERDTGELVCGRTTVDIVPFAWEDEETLDQLCRSRKPQLILAADVVYDSSVVPALVRVLHRFLSNAELEKEPVSAYVSCTVRAQETLQTFQMTLENFGLRWNVLQFSPSDKRFHHDKNWKVSIFEINCPR